MENPTLPTHLADAAERSKKPRIPGIGAGNRPSDLGFQESEATLPQNEAGFQESKLETDTARANCRNRNRKRVRRSLQYGRASLFHLIIHKR